MSDLKRISESISKCDILFKNLEDLMPITAAQVYQNHYFKFKRRFYDLKRWLKKRNDEIKKLKNEKKESKIEIQKLKNKIEELEIQNTKYLERLEFEIKVRATYHRKANELNEKIEKLKKDIEDYDDLKFQILTKNTFLIEKHLTSKYAKWLVEYNKSNTT